MPARRSRVERQPCVHCHESHLKCDNLNPKCRQCRDKNHECIRPPKKTIFRHWSKKDAASTFAQDQVWVNSARRRTATRKVAKPRNKPPLSVGDSDVLLGNASASSPLPDASTQANVSTSPYTVNSDTTPRTVIGSGSQSRNVQDHVTASPFSHAGTPTRICHNSGFEDNRSIHGDNDPIYGLVDNTQEACLLRYFIEELAHWFDLCDELCHFQLEVPRRARRCLPLRHAICSVASRHLARRPQYVTPAGIMYRGQLLPHLTDHTAVEYMLQCIPALSDFHRIQDAWYQENIMAAAVILRQCEELDDDIDTERRISASATAGIQNVNFLHVTQMIIEGARTLERRSSLVDAVLWMALRQDIYFCVIRERAPRMEIGAEERNEASSANRLVVFAGDVACWRWGDSSAHEWERLMLLQLQLQQEHLTHCIPILEKAADKAKGEIFPTIWYAADAELTAVQYFILAQAILIAEDPHLDHAPNPRLAHRKAEHQVRAIILKLCGIALGHSKLAPAFVIAAAGILHYGDFFTDPREQEALIGVVERSKDMYAGSPLTLHKSYQVLRERWVGGE